MNRDLSAHLTKKEEEPLLEDGSDATEVKKEDQAIGATLLEEASLADNLITNNDMPPSSIIINTTANAATTTTSSQLMMDDFSPVPTAETPDIMTPSDSELLLQKWTSNASF